MVKDQLMDRQTSVLTEEELIYILEVQIPDLLDRRPELQRRIYSAFLDLFARREEIAAIMEELRSLHTEFQEFREETAQRFDQVEQRFERIDSALKGRPAL
jgi:chromosome segregation ATPase